jgi:hypothetical protein
MDLSNPCQTTTFGAEVGFTTADQEGGLRTCVNSKPINEVTITPPSQFDSPEHLYNYDLPLLLYYSTRLEVCVLLYSLATTKRSYCFFTWNGQRWMFVRMPFGFLFPSKVYCSDESNLWQLQRVSHGVF